MNVNIEKMCEICNETYGPWNNGPHNLCEGSRCEDAEETWVEWLETQLIYPKVEGVM